MEHITNNQFQSNLKIMNLLISLPLSKFIFPKRTIEKMKIMYPTQGTVSPNKLKIDQQCFLVDDPIDEN